MTINENIRALRLKNRLSQEKLGELLGVSGQAVSKWEQTLTSPDISLLPMLAEVFGVTIDALFEGVQARKFPGYQGKKGELFAAYTHEGGTEEDFRKASDCYGEIILSGSATAEDYLCYGMLHRVRGMRDIEKALYFYRKLISDFNDKRDIHWMAAHQAITNLLTDMGRIEEAVKEHKKWRDTEPDCAWAHVSYSYALECAGDLKEALEEIELALKLDANDCNAQTAAGDLCGKLGRCEEAIAHWTKAYELDPTCISCLFSKAEMFAQNGQKAQAVETFEEILNWLEANGYDMELEGTYPRQRIAEILGEV